MKVYFRVDASNLMGTGHVMRCLTLAKGLRDRGVISHFICRAHPGHLISLIAEQGFAVSTLAMPASHNEAKPNDYASWLGATLIEDLEETKKIMEGQLADWLIVDHYALDASWEKPLRAFVKKIAVIDDLANRKHDADVLIDQNFSNLGKERYQDLVPENCLLALGPQFALLASDYGIHRSLMKPRTGAIKNVLVFFGGSDPDNMTGMAVEALSRPELAHFNVDIVLGANNHHKITTRAGMKIHKGLPHLAELMASSDLAIGAGGVTTWERMCLGLPTLVVSIADNQVPACQSLAYAGLIDYLGDHKTIRSVDLAKSLLHVLSHPHQVMEISQKSAALVDGQGVARILEIIDPTPFDQIWFKQHLIMLRILIIGEVKWIQEEGTHFYEFSLNPVFKVSEKQLIPLLKNDGVPMAFADAKTKDKSFAITILSDQKSWLNDWLPDLIVNWMKQGHRILWTHSVNDLKGGDFCFYLSCGQIVPQETLARYKNNLVVHESDLPKGKGWSPLTWQILADEKRIPVTLFEAQAKVDSGVIYGQEWMTFEGNELIEDLREKQATETFKLCQRFVNNYPTILKDARPQSGEESFYPRRRPQDSQLSIQATLEECFPTFRVVDNERYPAFFEYRQKKYFISIREADV